MLCVIDDSVVDIEIESLRLNVWQACLETGIHQVRSSPKEVSPHLEMTSRPLSAQGLYRGAAIRARQVHDQARTA